MTCASGSRGGGQWDVRSGVGNIGRRQGHRVQDGSWDWDIRGELMGGVLDVGVTHM